jgi:hypothetical protein
MDLSIQASIQASLFFLIAVVRKKSLWTFLSPNTIYLLNHSQGPWHWIVQKKISSGE